MIVDAGRGPDPGHPLRVPTSGMSATNRLGTSLIIHMWMASHESDNKSLDWPCLNWHSLVEILQGFYADNVPGTPYVMGWVGLISSSTCLTC